MLLVVAALLIVAYCCRPFFHLPLGSWDGRADWKDSLREDPILGDPAGVLLRELTEQRKSTVGWLDLWFLFSIQCDGAVVNSLPQGSLCLLLRSIDRVDCVDLLFG